MPYAVVDALRSFRFLGRVGTAHHNVRPWSFRAYGRPISELNASVTNRQPDQQSLTSVEDDKALSKATEIRYAERVLALDRVARRAVR